MPLYTYTCADHGNQLVQFPFGGAEPVVRCHECGKPVERNMAADWKTVLMNTSSCRDHNHIPERARVTPHHGNVSRASAEALERAYGKHIAEQRKVVKRSGSLRKTHSVPAEAFFGKIKETGDKEYWDNPSNLANHRDYKL